MIAFIISGSNFIYAQHDHSKMDMKHGDHGMMEHNNTVKLNDENLTKAYMHYTMINEALVEANAAKVQMVSKMLVGILNSYGKASDAAQVATQLASTSDIKEQRVLFSNLTLEFEPLLKGNIVEGEIFKTFCPMANNGGSYWFSNSSEIANPYLSKNMATCGSVKETFKSM
ncbi:DUF3347 domain-containing protein [Tenacibaculum sp.]|uniref:DUF3347 domain-containing protein n=1 Tax=Tenacibaculum sp. TaxID=1906242 RepID=UPI003D0C12B6